MQLPTSGFEEADTRYVFFRPFQESLLNIARLLESTKLCKRCREADYEGFLNERDETRPQYERILYPQGSFRDNCPVCILIMSVMERQIGSAIGKNDLGEKLDVRRCYRIYTETGELVHKSIEFAFEGIWARYQVANID